MHRIQVNTIPVSKQSRIKDSGSEPRVRGERFDAVLDKTKEKISNSKKEVSGEKPKGIKKGRKKKVAEYSGKNGKKINTADSAAAGKSSKNLKGLKFEEVCKKDKKTVKERSEKLSGIKVKGARSLKNIKGDGKKSSKIKKHIEVKAENGKKEAEEKTDLDESLIPQQIFREYRKNKAEKHSGDSKKAENMVVKKNGKNDKDAKQVSGHKVIDLRTADSKRTDSAKNDFSGDNTPKDGTQQNDGNRSSGVETLTMADRGDSSFHSEIQNAAEPKAVLLSELKEKLNDRIVKQSSIVLKDKDAGEIRLILKPESLGKVRIRLHLDDNNLTGKIIVDTSAAKDAFEQNMFRLEKAFAESGFEMGSLDVSVGDRNNGKSKDESEIVSDKVIKIIEDSVPGIDDGIYSSNVIDLVV